MNNSTVSSRSFSFARQARIYFAGRYFYAYSYYYGNENRDLTRQADCR